MTLETDNSTQVAQVAQVAQAPSSSPYLAGRQTRTQRQLEHCLRGAGLILTKVQALS